MIEALFFMILAPTDINALNLVCSGAGTAIKQEMTTYYNMDNKGKTTWVQAIDNRSIPFRDQLLVRINGNGGEIMMPRQMLPDIRGGREGWFKIKNIKTNESGISGSITLNLFSNPKMRLDRITGAISISGQDGSYSGECMPYDAATAMRKF